MMRYIEDDDFGTPQNAFNICTFWLISALAAIGRKDDARAIFEAMLQCRNSLGLLSEDTDPVTGEMWGIFPRPIPWSASSIPPWCSPSLGKRRFDPTRRPGIERGRSRPPYVIRS